MKYKEDTEQQQKKIQNTFLGTNFDCAYLTYIYTNKYNIFYK